MDLCWEEAQGPCRSRVSQESSGRPHQQASWPCAESRIRSSMTSGFPGIGNMFWTRVDLGITMSPPRSPHQGPTRSLPQVQTQGPIPGIWMLSPSGLHKCTFLPPSPPRHQDFRAYWIGHAVAHQEMLGQFFSPLCP